MLRRPPTGLWRRARGFAAIWVTGAGLVCGCFGGQSGGETDNSEAPPEHPAPCACIPVGERPVRAKITRLEGGCVELVVLEQLVAPFPDEHAPLTVGETFGGVVKPLCTGSAEPSEGDEVLAMFTRGTQDGVTCPEYRACSLDRCGNPNDAATVDPECAERRAQDPTIDCPPSASAEALAAYDRCDTQCLEQTRSACVARTAETQLGGNVSVARWENEGVSFFWAGQQRQEPFSQLVTPECNDRHQSLWSEYAREHVEPHSEEDTPQAVAPQEPPASPACPLPPRK